MLASASGYPLTDVTAVTVLNGPVRTCAQAAVYLSSVCRTLDRLQKDILELEEWCNQSRYKNSRYELDHTIPAYTQEDIAQHGQVAAIVSTCSQRTQQVAILVPTGQQQVTIPASGYIYSTRTATLTSHNSRGEGL